MLIKKLNSEKLGNWAEIVKSTGKMDSNWNFGDSCVRNTEVNKVLEGVWCPGRDTAMCQLLRE